MVLLRPDRPDLLLLENLHQRLLQGAPREHLEERLHLEVKVEEVPCVLCCCGLIVGSIRLGWLMGLGVCVVDQQHEQRRQRSTHHTSATHPPRSAWPRRPRSWRAQRAGCAAAPGRRRSGRPRQRRAPRPTAPRGTNLRCVGIGVGVALCCVVVYCFALLFHCVWRRCVACVLCSLHLPPPPHTTRRKGRPLIGPAPVCTSVWSLPGTGSGVRSRAMARLEPCARGGVARCCCGGGGDRQAGAGGRVANMLPLMMWPPCWGRRGCCGDGWKRVVWWW